MQEKYDDLARLSSAGFEQPGEKRAYNRRLFREVAPVYDSVTRILSMGRDAAWKRTLLEWLGPHQSSASDRGPVCIDLACGTGDFGRMILERNPDARMFGLDLSPEMMGSGVDAAQRGNGPVLLQADMAQIPFADGCADVITGGYAIRNAPRLDAALGEISRVLRPGGVAALLEFSKSDVAPVRATQLGALSMWGQLWGWVYHRKPQVYGYIAGSLKAFPTQGALKRLYEEHGLELVRERVAMMGMIRLQLLQKPL